MKPNFNFNKRKREEAKKKKREEKMAKRFGQKNEPSVDGTSLSEMSASAMPSEPINPSA